MIVSKNCYHVKQVVAYSAGRQYVKRIQGGKTKRKAQGKKGKVYTVGHHGQSLCLQRQPGIQLAFESSNQQKAIYEGVSPGSFASMKGRHSDGRHLLPICTYDAHRKIPKGRLNIRRRQKAGPAFDMLMSCKIMRYAEIALTDSAKKL